MSKFFLSASVIPDSAPAHFKISTAPMRCRTAATTGGFAAEGGVFGDADSSAVDASSLRRPASVATPASPGKFVTTEAEFLLTDCFFFEGFLARVGTISSEPAKILPISFFPSITVFLSFRS